MKPFPVSLILLFSFTVGGVEWVSAEDRSPWFLGTKTFLLADPVASAAAVGYEASQLRWILPPSSTMEMSLAADALSVGILGTQDPVLTSFDMGGKYQFYGIPFVSLGVKGSLDYDHWIEYGQSRFDLSQTDRTIRLDWTRGLSSHLPLDIGVKAFAEAVAKPLPGIVFDLWADGVYDKLETNLPRPHPTFEPTFTLIPKVILEPSWGFPVVRLVTEAFAEMRQYIGRTIDIAGTQADSYVKGVFTQHGFLMWNFGDHWSLSSYVNLTLEKIQSAPIGKLTFKVSPKLEFDDGTFRLCFSGGEYRFQNEMGMLLDNREAFGYTLVGKPLSGPVEAYQNREYESVAYSVAALVGFRPWRSLTLSLEGVYRTGDWISYNKQVQADYGHLSEVNLRASVQQVWPVADHLRLVGRAEFDLLGNRVGTAGPIPDSRYLLVSLGLESRF